MKPKGITYRDSSYTPPPKPAPKPRTTLADLPEPLTYPSKPRTTTPPLVEIDKPLSSTLSDSSAKTPSDIEFRRLKWDVDDLKRDVRTLERNQRTQQQEMSSIKTDVSEIRRMLQELIDRENRSPPTETPSTSSEPPRQTTLQDVAPGHTPMRYPDIEKSMVAPDNEVVLPRVN
jgi:hypothetical protein